MPLIKQPSRRLFNGPRQRRTAGTVFYRVQHPRDTHEIGVIIAEILTNIT